MIINSCQNNQSNKTVNLSKTEVNVDTSLTPVTKKLIEQTQIDTLTVHERFFVGERFRSHIELDFALTYDVINNSNQVSEYDQICAISVIPDTTWINQQQKNMGENWNEIVSDNQYYEQLAIDKLKTNKIPTFFAPREKRYIRLYKSDNSNVVVDLTKMEDAWGLILFNGTDDPVFWRSAEIDDELKEVYRK